MIQAHILISDKQRNTLPPLYSTEEIPDPIAHIKLFTPDSNWTWYITEYSQEEDLCFGLIIGHETELGYFSLNELKEVRGAMGLKIERDIHFKPERLSVLKQH
ncbi:MAG: DUF2958 domain-containing protein [Sulfurimonas sp.]